MPKPHPAPSRKAPAAVTPMAYARVMARAMQQGGIDPGAALREAQIAPDRLDKPLARINARQMELLSAAAMQALDDEALGAFGRRLPWGSYGMLARASISSPDLGLALRRWCRHHALLADDVVLRVEVHDDEACIDIEEGPAHLRLAPDARELSLVYLLRNVHGLASWLVDSRIPLLAAQFPFEAPPHAPAFGHMFPGPVSFSRSRALLRFDARYLALPLRRDDRALHHMLERALPLTVRPYRRDRLLVQQVRQLLRQQPVAVQDAQGLADSLNVSVRTLHRQLRGHGASVQALKDEMRQERARELLLRTRQPLKQVAAAVGFGSEKSFIRAFGQWTGTSPAAFRAQGTEVPQPSSAGLAPDGRPSGIEGSGRRL